MLRLIRLGRFADAARALTAEPLAPLNGATLRALQEKFPPAPEGEAMPPSTLVPGEDVPFTKECVRACLASFKRGSGAGLSTLTPDILKLAVSAAMRAHRDEELLDSIVQLMQVLCKGQAPQEVAPWLCGGRLIPVGAKVRPIIVSDVLARLCSKAMLSLELDTVTHDRVFKGIQGGVGEPGAVERTVHMLRQEMQSRADQVDHAILQVDFRNGFNSVHRAPIMEQLNTHTPALGRWFRWAHLRPLALVLSDGTTMEAPTGTGQGDPASPAYFAMTLQPVLDRIADSWGDAVGVHRAFLDDLVISGPAHVLVEILQFLREDAMVLHRGLTVRPDKCCIFMPNQGVPEGLHRQYGIPPDIQLVTMDGGITALGVPLGSDDYVTRLMDGIAASVKQFGDNLEALEHGQLELLLHTYSGGLNRVMYLYRCLPSESLGTISRACEEESARLLQRLTAPASGVTGAMTAQAHLPRRYGGLGLLEVQHAGDAAFIAATLATLPQDRNASVTLAHNLDFTSALNRYNRLGLCHK
ncbi:MAG: reverse transcriptase domain-containing protein [Roseimicrobium sp.]